MKYIIVLLFFLSTLFGVTEEQIKVVYTYNFMKNINFSDKEKFDVYKLLVVTDNDVLIQMFSLLSKKKKLYNKKINLTFASSIDNHNSYHVIYLDDKFSKYYLNIFKDKKRNGTLIISNNVNDKKNVMINMFRKDEKINFEINRANILNKNLMISPDMILLGGSEIDVAEIYRDIQETLETKKIEYNQLNTQIQTIKEDGQKLKEEVLKQNLVLSHNLQELEYQKNELAKKDNDIILKNKEIIRKNEDLEVKNKDIKVKQLELENILNFLENKKIEIEKQKALIAENNLKYQNNLLEIDKKEQLLVKLNEDIVLQNSIVQEQKSIINTKSITIFYLAGVVAIFLVLVIIIIVAYFKIRHDKRVINEQLINLHLAREKQKELFEELQRAKDEVEEIHKHTRESIEYAALIQSALIPENRIFEHFFEDYFVIWQPKDIVGGDIYLMHEMNENELILMIIDCTGHGVPGAFVTMLVKAIERQLMTTIDKDEIISPAKILSVFNKNIKSLLKQESIDSVSNAGFDGGVVYYNKKEKIIKFAGAQTALFYIDTNNELHNIQGSRHSVGYKKSDANFNFQEYSISVTKGMQFYCSTDGYLDQNGGEKGFPFGKKKFTQIIQEYHQEPMKQQQSIFLSTIQNYQKMIEHNERNDDMTVVGFRT